MMDKAKQFRCGFVAVLGRPNVGKSTLVNAYMGTKVSIVSPKPQTTRNRITGILNDPRAQLILLDTPGYCDDGGPLKRALRQTARSAAADADLTLVVAEVRGDEPKIGEADHAVLQVAARSAGKVILAINKVDLLPRKDVLLPWMAAYTRDYDLECVVPISAHKGYNLDVLATELMMRLPPGPSLFPPDMHTDQAERFLCAELVREQVLLRTQQEVPHSAAVTVECFEDGRDAQRPLCRIEARIYLERDSQKAIVIGRGGSVIKAIGQAARQRIEQMLGCQIFLQLTAHVDARWTRSGSALRRYGLASEMRL